MSLGKKQPQPNCTFTGSAGRLSGKTLLRLPFSDAEPARRPMLDNIA